MSRVRVENEQLIITMQGSRKFWASKSEVTIDMKNVTGVTSGIEWKDTPKFFDRVHGTDAGFYFGGKFEQDGKTVFYDLKKREDAVVISINDDDFDTLIIGVDDSAATVKLIKQALTED